MTVLSAVAVALLLILAFWLRAAGTALNRVPRADALRDSSEGVRGAATVAQLLEERDVIGPAVGVVASALLIICSVLGTVTITADSEEDSALLIALAVGLVVFLLGDLIPRWVGRLNPRRFAYVSSGLLRSAVALGGFANDLLPEGDESEEGFSTPAVDEADDHERELIDSVLEFTETVVREVMTPRPDMVTVDATAGIEELIDISSEEGFSRIPVTSAGDVVGIVILKDLLPMLTEDSRPQSVVEVMRPAEFVPEIKHASTLLTEMQETATHQVIVVDEYGDVAGLVTIEDLLEELVGEIADESDLEEDLVVETEDGWAVDARLPVDDLEKVTGINLPDEEWDTVGGLVLGLAERIPEEGEVFSAAGLDMRVTRMQGRRVSLVHINVNRPTEAE